MSDILIYTDGLRRDLRRLAHGQLVERAPLSWRLRNLPHLIPGWIAVQLARTFTRLTGIPTMTSCLRIRKIVGGSGGLHIVDYGIVSYRVVTNAGVNYLTDAFQGTVEPELMKFHAIGTGTNAEAAGDTGPQTEWTSGNYSGGVRPTGSLGEGASANIFRTVGTNTKTDAGTSAVTEHVLMSSATIGAGTAWDRSVFAAINLSQGDGLQTTYELTTNSGG